MEIKNNVKNYKTITVEEFLSLDFNRLKDKKRDINKLKNAILKDGFNFPVVVWKEGEYVIDGTGRKLAVEELIKEGNKVEEIPVVYIEADSLEHAKKKTLQMSSVHGKITNESYNEFIEDFYVEEDLINLNIEEVKVSSEDEVKGDIEFGEEIMEENNYIVFTFDSSMDWNVIEEVFKLKKELSRNAKKLKQTGIGRVVKGQELLNALNTYGNNNT